MAKLKIEYRKTASLIPYVGNARTHTENQVAQIAASIKEFGFVNPILVDSKNVIIAGHGRVMAAALLQMDEIPTILISHLSERERKALILADNKIAQNAGWDTVKLADELSALSGMDFDLLITGFDEQEIDALLKDNLDLLPDDWKASYGGDEFPIAPPPPPQAAQEQEPQTPQPPAQFQQYDTNVEVTHCCPSCGYKWSGPTK